MAKMKTEISSESPIENDALSRVARWIVVALVLMFVLTAIYFFVFSGVDPRVFQIVVIQNFAASVGLPAAAGAALFIVLVLKVTTGPIEIQAPGFRLKGASGPILLWVVCFVAITWGIWLLWR